MAPNAARGQVLVLATRVNGVVSPAAEQILQLDNGGLAVGKDLLQRWRVQPPPIAPVAVGGASYYPLDALPGWHHVLDHATQELQLDIPATSFLPTTIGLEPAPRHDLRTPPGAFANYDLLLQSLRGMRNVNALLEAGAFNASGVATSTFFWHGDDQTQRLVRLDTGWLQDQPDRLARLQFGDGITRAGSWGLPVRFGGMQWRTNFDTQPGFIPFPQPGVAGVAALPSTVDVYVNNALQFSRSVPPGPFEISNVPVVTGSGDVQLVVRDLLGRQQIVTQSYYASPSLLRTGLSEYAYEAGFVREDYGLRSDHYGKLFARALHRHGVSDGFTREIQAEVLRAQQTFGLGGAWFHPGLGTMQAAMAASRGPEGTGTSAKGGIERIGRRYSLSAQIQASSARYTQLGLATDRPHPRRTFNLRLGMSPGTLPGSLSVTRVRQQYWGQIGSTIVSLNYSQSLSRDTFLTFYALRSATGNDTSNAIGVSISRMLGEQTAVSAQVTRQGAGNDASVQLQRNLPEGPGFGYRLLAGRGFSSRQEASATWQGDAVALDAGAAYQDGNTSVRLGASGGMAFLGDARFIARRIDDSFAVVDTAGLPNVRILHENRVAARTDERGLALIPHLRAYQMNRISLDQADLPIEAQADAIELKLTPAVRSGVYGKFPISMVNGGRLVMALEDGTLLPPGATVRVAGQAGEFPVGERGEVFLPLLSATNDLVASWNNRRCAVHLSLPPGRHPLDALGRHVCKGIEP